MQVAYIDWKSFGGKKFTPYAEYGEQLAAYGAGNLGFSLINVGISTTRIEPVTVYVWPDVEDLWHRWLCTLELWQRRNNYRPETR